MFVLSTAHLGSKAELGAGVKFTPPQSIHGAMGGGQSIEVGGFRIFKVNPGSPAAEAGLEVFFDFIVEIDGVHMDADQATFASAIQEAENQRTKLVVHNIRTHTARDVYVTPRRWGGAGLLGAVVRYDTLESAEGQGMRVLSVFPNSPAEAAGLVPNKDFLLGTTEVMFRDMDELTEVVNLYMGTELKIYVYNIEAESIREVVIVPSTQWGGDGAIGADIRTGLLHRIPAPRRALNIQPQDLGSAAAEARQTETGAGNRAQTLPLPKDIQAGSLERPPAGQVDLQQVQPLLAQVQSQLQQLQDLQLREPLRGSVSLAICHCLTLRSQGHLTDVQQEHFRQLALLGAKGWFQRAVGSAAREPPCRSPVFELPAAAKAIPWVDGRCYADLLRLQRGKPCQAAAALPSSPLDMLAPGIIYETAALGLELLLIACSQLPISVTCRKQLLRFRNLS
ncbi:GORASP2 [Symbiodinium sp. CCMP2592]|nr:GORASP2 [Symbiodinium sp. CCMP2592]